MDKRRMDELMVEVGVKESVNRKRVRIRLKWAGHVEGKEDETLAKRVEGKEARKNAKGGLR